MNKCQNEAKKMLIHSRMQNTNLFLTLDILKKGFLVRLDYLFVTDILHINLMKKATWVVGFPTTVGGDVTPSILNFMEMGIVSKLKTDH